MNDDTSEPDLSTEPPVFVDEAILPAKNIPWSNTKPQGRPYLISNRIFYADDVSHDEFREFQVYADRFTNINDDFVVDNDDVDSQDVYSSTTDSEFDDDDSICNDRDLKMVIQRVPRGIVINSNVFLTDEQWNTIVFVDDKRLCVACNMFITETCPVHIQMADHKAFLDNWQPLARFELSITRQIREKYHCAVCNETFNLDDETQHVDSKSHEGNLLTAINKVSDLDLSPNNDANANNDCYRYNGNALNNAGDNDDSSYASKVKLWNVSRQNSSMLKKSNTPMFVERVFGNKICKVKVESHHMVLVLQSDRFYCMACKIYGRASDIAQHCAESSHLEILDRCVVIDEFGDLYVRMLNEQFYHCGQCNSLVPSHNIENHLKLHGMKPKNALEIAKKYASRAVNGNNGSDISRSGVNGDSESANNDKTVNNCGNKSNDTKVVNDTENNNNDSRNSHNDIVTTVAPNAITDTAFINPFGYTIAIPLLSLHVLMKSLDVPDFYCGLCGCIFPENGIMVHINSISHIQMMQMKPFLIPFECNLIRDIREYFHCAICNILIPRMFINRHIREPTHMQLLIKARGINIHLPPTMNGSTPHNAQKPEVIPTKPNTNNDNGNKVMKTAVTINSTNNEVSLTKETDATVNGEADLTIDDAESVDFDLNDYVYVKLKNSYFKISLTSYNTLVSAGDGSRFCFLCSSRVYGEELKRHVTSRPHLENVGKSKFLDNYESNLLRQILLTYHCSVCNVIVSRRELQNHLSWPTHVTETTAVLASTKKSRKTATKSGKTIHAAITTKEAEHPDQKEASVKVLFKVRKSQLEKKKKIIILKGNVLKMDFENWNGVCPFNGGWKCLLCQEEVGEDLGGHVRGEGHLKSLNLKVKEDKGHLFRQINETTLHCIMCNVVLPDQENIVMNHVGGKKHKVMFKNVSTASNTELTDCETDVLEL